MTPGIYVTGTGTGVGKTLVTCLLVRELRAAGRTVRALKPVISGFDSGAVADCDSGRLLAAMGEAADDRAVGSISPWRFEAPISPDMAAVREGRRLDVGEIAGFCRYAGPADDDAVVLVEGVGGAMVPLSDHETVLDWMAALAWPVALVAGSYLGTLSHTLTAAEAIRLRGLSLAAIVISESPESPVPLAETAATMERFADGIPVIELAHLGADPWGVRDIPAIAGRLGLPA